MIGTLIAELVILEIGRYMEAPMITQFCLFAQVALVVEYCLEMTFFMAILSIDINRAEVYSQKKKKGISFYFTKNSVHCFDFLLFYVNC